MNDGALDADTQLSSLLSEFVASDQSMSSEYISAQENSRLRELAEEFELAGRVIPTTWDDATRSFIEQYRSEIEDHYMYCRACDKDD